MKLLHALFQSPDPKPKANRVSKLVRSKKCAKVVYKVHGSIPWQDHISPNKVE